MDHYVLDDPIIGTLCLNGLIALQNLLAIRDCFPIITSTTILNPNNYNCDIYYSHLVLTMCATDAYFQLLIGCKPMRIQETLTNVGTINLEVRHLLLLCFLFNVTPTAMVIWRRRLVLKSHPTDW